MSERADPTVGLNHAELAFARCLVANVAGVSRPRELVDGVEAVVREKLTDERLDRLTEEDGDSVWRGGRVGQMDGSRMNTVAGEIKRRHDVGGVVECEVDAESYPYDRLLAALRAAPERLVRRLGVFQFVRLSGEVAGLGGESVVKMVSTPLRELTRAADRCEPPTEPEQARLAEMYVARAGEEFGVGSDVAEADLESGLMRAASVLGWSTAAGAAVGHHRGRIQMTVQRLSGEYAELLRQHYRVAAVSSRRGLAPAFMRSVRLYVKADAEWLAGILETGEECRE